MTKFNRNTILLLCIGLANFGACGSSGTNYVYYIIHPEVKPPMLYGNEPKDDLDLDKTCMPDPECSQPNHPAMANCGKCIGMLAEEFYKSKKELLQLRADLKACQHGPNPSK